MGDAIDRQPRILRADAFEEGLRPVGVSVVCHKNESPTCHPVILVELWPSPSRPAVFEDAKPTPHRRRQEAARRSLPTQGEIGKRAECASIMAERSRPGPT